MGLFFYNIFLLLFRAGISIAALFNSKARKWTKGREGIWEKLEADFKETEGKNPGTIWVHCASLGEFEQGRPVLEKLKTSYPGHKILLTFFSPSGYEIRKDYKGANWVHYLPLDSAGNARRFLQIVKPSLVIFVKYEFWYHYLSQVRQNRIPLLLISAIFRKESIFFKWHGGLQRKMLSFFDQLFVQDEVSKTLLAGINIHHVSVAGDTRFDRVVEIAEQAAAIPQMETFTRNKNVIVAGSSWPPDEEILKQTVSEAGGDLKLIIAPHETNSEHITLLEKLFPGSIKWTEMQTLEGENLASILQNSRVMIIDTIGLLSRLYRYATISYIGGGFGKGIHNTLEAAVYGKPVIFGPTHQKFREAIELAQRGGAIPITNADDFRKAVKRFLEDQQTYQQACESARKYVWENRGATGRVLEYIQEKRLLTS